MSGVPLSSKRLVHFFGDSIIRGLETNIINSSFSSEVFCFPGCTISGLRTRVKETITEPNFNVDVVFLHVGTNNLNRSVWDIDVKQYRLLFYTVRELYRSATIIFNAILPRWDSEDLYASSLYYNIKLNNLACTLENCLYITQSDLFQNFDDLHAYDGLHLNFYGKIVFAEAVIGAITKCLTPRIKGAVYVPPELRKLWSPKPQRREKRRDNEIKERKQKMEENKEKKIETEETKRSMEKERTRKMEERKRKQAERKRKMEKARKRRMEKEAERRRRESVPIDPLVFIRPRRYAVPPRPPDLPPNQYIPDSPAHWLIPYVSLPAPSMTFHTMSDLPAPMSPYLKRKLLGKRKRIQARARKRKKHRKKVTGFTCSLLSLLRG